MSPIVKVPPELHTEMVNDFKNGVSYGQLAIKYTISPETARNHIRLARANGKITDKDYNARTPIGNPARTIIKGRLPENPLEAFSVLLESSVSTLTQVILVGGLNTQFQDWMSIVRNLNNAGISLGEGNVYTGLNKLSELRITDTMVVPPNRRFYRLSGEPEIFCPSVAFHMMMYSVESGKLVENYLGYYRGSRLLGRALAMISLRKGEDPYTFNFRYTQRILSDLEKRGVVTGKHLSEDSVQLVDSVLLPISWIAKDPLKLTPLRKRYDEAVEHGELYEHCRRVVSLPRT